MSNINNLITSHNIQGELIKNKIEQNDLMFEAFKEQKYNELLKENQQLKDRINKTVDILDNYQNNLYSKEARKTLDDDIELALDLLKGDKK